MAGKARSRWNAVRHGILARCTPIRDGDGRENVAEFQHLFTQLRRDLQPATALEEILIERIASCYWRLGRVVHAETTNIQSQIEDARFECDQENRRRVFELADDGVEPVERIQDLPGVDSMLEIVRDAQARIEAVGFLDPEELEQFTHVVGYSLAGMERPESRASKTAEQERKTAVLQALARLEQDLESLRSRLTERHERARARAPRLLAVPDEATANRLLRYEGAIQAQLFKALHELERVQRMRAGEPVPPRLHVQVEATE